MKKTPSPSLPRFAGEGAPSRLKVGGRGLFRHPLRSLGYGILRVPNHRLFHDPEGVVDDLLRIALNRG
jgi:hypothetical protein